jgi:hypothetical protein
MDEEWARIAVEMEYDELEGKPPTGEDPDEELSRPIGPLYYDPSIARLDLIADRLMAVRTAVQAGYAKDHREPAFQLLDRPETAVDRERERRNINILLETDRLFREEGFAFLALE